MGYLRPTAIIVTGTYETWAADAHAKALAIFAGHGLGETVTELLGAGMNGTQSFMVGWDGSKEGWEESDKGDEARAEFVAWLRAQAYGDGSSPLDSVEVQYGGDDKEVIALAHDGESWAMIQGEL